MKYIYFQWIRLLKNKIAAELRIYWKERFTTDSYLVFHWMAAVSFIQIHWSLPVNTNANLGSDVPVVPLI